MLFIIDINRFMGLDNEKKIIDTIRQCQRNWDLTKRIPQEHIDHWIYIATHSPSKQDEAYYNLYVITNIEKIKLLLDHTWGHTFEIAPGNYKAFTRQPQMGANAYFLFGLKDLKKIAPLTKEQYPDGTLFKPEDPRRTKNKYVSLGIAVGLIAQSAARLGYKVGFNTNHCDQNIWKKELQIPESEEIYTGIGIGYPQEGRERNETDETEYMISNVITAKNKRYNHNDPYVQIDGKQVKVSKIWYRLHSNKQKNIQVKTFY